MLDTCLETNTTFLHRLLLGFLGPCLIIFCNLSEANGLFSFYSGFYMQVKNTLFYVVWDYFRHCSIMDNSWKQICCKVSWNSATQGLHRRYCSSCWRPWHSQVYFKLVPVHFELMPVEWFRINLWTSHCHCELISMYKQTAAWGGHKI